MNHPHAPSETPVVKRALSLAAAALLALGAATGCRTSSR